MGKQKKQKKPVLFADIRTVQEQYVEFLKEQKFKPTEEKLNQKINFLETALSNSGFNGQGGQLKGADSEQNSKERKELIKLIQSLSEGLKTNIDEIDGININKGDVSDEDTISNFLTEFKSLQDRLKKHQVKLETERDIKQTPLNNILTELGVTKERVNQYKESKSGGVENKESVDESKEVVDESKEVVDESKEGDLSVDADENDNLVNLELLLSVIKTENDANEQLDLRNAIREIEEALDNKTGLSEEKIQQFRDLLPAVHGNTLLIQTLYEEKRLKSISQNQNDPNDPIKEEIALIERVITELLTSKTPSKESLLQKQQYLNYTRNIYPPDANDILTVVPTNNNGNPISNTNQGVTSDGGGGAPQGPLSNTNQGVTSDGAGGAPQGPLPQGSLSNQASELVENGDGRQDVLSAEEIESLVKSYFVWKTDDTKYASRESRGKIGYGQSGSHNVQPVEPFGIALKQTLKDHESLQLFDQMQKSKISPFSGPFETVEASSNQKQVDEPTAEQQTQDLPPTPSMPVGRIDNELYWVPLFGHVSRFFLRSDDYQQLLTNVTIQGDSIVFKKPPSNLSSATLQSTLSKMKMALLPLGIQNVPLHDSSANTQYAEWLELKQLLRAIAHYNKETVGEYNTAGVFSGNIRDAVENAIRKTIGQHPQFANLLASSSGSEQAGTRGLNAAVGGQSGGEQKDGEEDGRGQNSNYLAFNPFQRPEKRLKTVSTSLPRFF